MSKQRQAKVETGAHRNPVCTHPLADEVVEKTEKLSVKEERQQQVALEEMNYNESEILKAYEALMKEDPR